MVARDAGVREQRRARPRLNSELSFSLHDADSARQPDLGDSSGANWESVRIHVEQPSRSRFFVLGYAEYAFLSLLDGKTSFSQALAVLAQRLGVKALDEQQAQSLMSWAKSEGIVDEVVDLPEDQEFSPASQRRLNPLFLKVPLGNPARFLHATYPLLKWLFAPPVVLAMLLLQVFAGSSLLGSLDELSTAVMGIVSPSNWLWLFAAWLGLKLIHEGAHAYVCHHFGGEVREAGVTLVLLTPIAYCDVNSSWSFASRWQRMAVAAAGIFAELVVASLCVVAWHRVESPFLAQFFVNVICMASLSTILFNANPLMRFDGYYLLADLVKIPNLYSLGNARMLRACQWLFTGEWPSLNRWERTSQEWFVWMYGVLSCLWRVFITITIVIAALALLGDFAGWIVVVVLGAMLPRFSPKRLSSRMAKLRLRRRAQLRAFLVTCVLAGAAWMIWGVVSGTLQQHSPLHRCFP